MGESYLSTELYGNKNSMERNKIKAVAVLVIDGSPSQHHGVVVGPFGSVAPTLFVAVPEVTASWVAHNAVRETLPYCEGKVHLDQHQRKTMRETENMTQRNHKHIF